jgi:hypothetical protein
MALLPIPSCAAEPSATALFELAELGLTGDQLAGALIDGLPRHADPLPADAHMKLVRAVRTIATPGNARGAQLAAFTEAWDPSQGAAVMEWYRSEAGARLLAMETAASKADWERELSRYIDRMMSEDPASLRRIKLLERIARATDIAQDSADIQSGVDRILTLAARELTPEADRPSDLAVKAGLRDRKAAALAGMRMQMSVVLQFIYRDASDDEVALQVDFVESEAGQWLLAANRSAILATLDDLQSDLQKQLLAQGGDSGE